MTELRLATNNLLHQKLALMQHPPEPLVGLDIDAAGLAELSARMPGKDFICHNAEELETCREIQNRSWDVILAADVVEHLSNPGRFLAGARQLLGSHGKLLITTPHAYSIKRMLSMVMLGREHVHPDHTAYYSLSTLTQVLNRSGFEVEKYFMFQWRNPFATNRIVNGVVAPLIWLTGGRLCDEIAIIARVSN